MSGNEGIDPHRLAGRADPPQAAGKVVVDPGIDPRERAGRPFSASLCVVDAGAGEAEVLAVRGEVDIATAPALRKTMRAALEHGIRPVVVDLFDVRFMDSTGVHVLVEAHLRLIAQDRRFEVVCRENSQPHRLLTLVGMYDTLTVHHSRESAAGAHYDQIRAQGPCTR